MKYGYFDETKKEYVITRPDTPAPWVNYLGSPEYGAIISNNAGDTSLTSLTNPEDIFISGIIKAKTTGRLPGSRWERI